MTCDRILRTDPDGKVHYKSKVAYDSLDKAILAAKKRNAEEHRTEKLEAYKCTYCFKYHIGRNGKKITEKEKIKYRQELGISIKVIGKINVQALQPKSGLKVVGWIDLNKIKY